VRDFLGIGLRFPDQRLEPRLQVFADPLSKHGQPSRHQAVALVPANIDSVELFVLDRKAAIGSVSRWRQVTLTQSLLRPE